MHSALASRPAVAEALIPDIPPGCKRLTPGPGYLDALVSDNVEFVNSDVTAFTPSGLRTADGSEHELDAIICATGFDVSCVPSFPIIGVGGASLQDTWKEDVVTYLGISVPRLPNFFMVLGPNTGVGSGSLLIVMEQQVAYVVEALNKIRREGYRSLCVRDAPAKAFIRYTDAYFHRTVFAGDCKSWYKNGASGPTRIRTLWPGSSSHAFLAFKYPRWEDYAWERDPAFEDDMAWLGNGDVSPEL
jgi:cation diffusion facilitator CzcD-associated flavoprotein CzcO